VFLGSNAENVMAVEVCMDVMTHITVVPKDLPSAIYKGVISDLSFP